MKVGGRYRWMCVYAMSIYLLQSTSNYALLASDRRRQNQRLNNPFQKSQESPLLAGLNLKIVVRIYSHLSTHLYWQMCENWSLRQPEISYTILAEHQHYCIVDEYMVLFRLKTSILFSRAVLIEFKFDIAAAESHQHKMEIYCLIVFSCGIVVVIFCYFYG